MVVELPLPWALSGAEMFALGAVALLDSLCCVKGLAFGSECGDIHLLRQIAKLLPTRKFGAAFVVERQKDPAASFATIQQRAVSSLLGKEAGSVLSQPNNTLGIAYCQALEQLESSMEPITVPRVGAGYHQLELLPNDTNPSATQLRTLLQNNQDCDLSSFMPKACADTLREAMNDGLGPVFPETMEKMMLSKLRTLSIEELANLPDISEGLENRLLEGIRRAASLEDLYSFVKTKRYSHARIRRLVLSAFLGITKEDTAAPPPYCRVLGIRKNSKKLLSEVKSNSIIPLITKYSDCSSLSKHGRHIFNLESQATNLYSLACPTVQPCGREMTTGMIVMI
jgi:predicted nucleotidyltransferase